MAAPAVLTGSEMRAAWHEFRTERAAKAKRLEHPGRKIGLPHGSYVTDIAERGQGVVLCSGCAHTFVPGRYGYYATREFRISGRCDGCKGLDHNSRFFIHEKFLGRMHGQCWTPR
jgi:hypothetical protein